RREVVPVEVGLADVDVRWPNILGDPDALDRANRVVARGRGECPIPARRHQIGCALRHARAARDQGHLCWSIAGPPILQTGAIGPLLTMPYTPLLGSAAFAPAAASAA